MESTTQNNKAEHDKDLQTLLDMEWAIIIKLYEKLKDKDLTTLEFSKLSISLANHINNQNKLYKLLNEQKETIQYHEQNLGDLILSVRPRIYRHRDQRTWKRRLSLRR